MQPKSCALGAFKIGGYATILAPVGHVYFVGYQ